MANGSPFAGFGAAVGQQAFQTGRLGGEKARRQEREVQQFRMFNNMMSLAQAERQQENWNTAFSTEQAWKRLGWNRAGKQFERTQGRADRALDIQEQHTPLGKLRGQSQFLGELGAEDAWKMPYLFQGAGARAARPDKPLPYADVEIENQLLADLDSDDPNVVATAKAKYALRHGGKTPPARFPLMGEAGFFDDQDQIIGQNIRRIGEQLNRLNSEVRSQPTGATDAQVELFNQLNAKQKALYNQSKTLGSPVGVNLPTFGTVEGFPGFEGKRKGPTLRGLRTRTRQLPGGGTVEVYRPPKPTFDNFDLNVPGGGFVL